MRVFCTRFIAAFTIIASLAIPNAYAAVGVPSSFSYQGRLSNSGGTLLTGTYCFSFSIYDAATSGTKLWPAGTPGTVNLTVTNGVFSANVGIDTPDALTFDFNNTDTAYLNVQVGSSCGALESLSPRPRITAAGYAINSRTVGGATPGTGADNILKLTAAGVASLGATNPGLTATGSNTLTVQASSTGDIRFFSASNSLTSAGLLTLANGATLEGSAGLTLGKASTTVGTMRFLNGTNANNVTIQSGTTSASYTLTLPTAQGASNTFLRNDGSGNLSWVAGGGGGSCTNCVLNDTSATDATNTIAPTTDVTGLTVRQTTAGSPTKNVFALTNSANSVTYFAVTSTGGITTRPANAEDVAVTLPAGSQLLVSASAAPTLPLAVISNAGQAATTAAANGLDITYVGGAAAIAASGIKVNLTPGGTTGGTWSGINIASSAASSGVNIYGLKVDNLASAGAGTETGMLVGTGWDVGVRIESGGLEILGQNFDPAAVSAGTAELFAATRANVPLLSVEDSTNLPHVPLQKAIFKRHIVSITPGSALAFQAMGSSTVTSGGTWAAGNTEADGDFLTATVTTTGTAGTGSRSIFYRGTTASGAGGFFFYSRFKLGSATAAYTDATNGARIYSGFTDQSLANSIGSDNPAGNRVGISYAPVTDGVAAGVTFKLVTRDGTTANRLSTTIPVAGASVYELYLSCDRVCSTIYYRFENVTAGLVDEGSTSTNLPTGSTAMGLMTSIGSIGTTGNKIFAIAQIYGESTR